MMLRVAPLTVNVPPSHRPLKPFVLIVDDHQPTLEQLKRLVELSGHVCVAAMSAVDALIYCDESRPAVVVTDFAMPRLNGDGLARWLKARYPSIPILLVTGELLDSKAIHVLEQTFTAVIAKPLEVESFLTLLNALMIVSGDVPKL